MQASSSDPGYLALLPLITDIANRLSAIEANLGSGGGSSDSAAGSGDDLPRSIKAFDTYAAECLDPFVATCNSLGDDAATVGNLIKDAWMEMRAFLLMASKCKEPASQQAIMPLLGNLSAVNKKIAASVQRNDWENHTKTCSEGSQCLNWLLVKPAPRDFIESYIGGSDYWANGIRKKHRTTNPTHVAFCDGFKKLLQELMAYVKEHHTTGVVWNNKSGMDVSEYKADGSATPPAAPAAQPKAAAAAAPAAAKSTAAPTANLFASLSKGGEITSGLKTVTKDMQTWRSEYKGGDAPAPKAPVAPKAPRVNPNDIPKGKERNEFQAAGNKWCVEYLPPTAAPVTITIGDKKETVYVLGCIGATITVSGKCKGIILDGCKKTKLFFDNAMASVEVVNCQRIQVTCNETVPSVAIDKTDGIVVHLPESSLNTTIVASKSSEMNVSFPNPDKSSADAILEKPIPEQYIHTVVGDKVTAEVSELYS